MKSASDIYAPMSGQVFEVNEELTSKPSLINKAAESNGSYHFRSFLIVSRLDMQDRGLRER